MEQWELSRCAWIVALLSPVSFRCSRSIAGNDRQGTTRDTDPLLLLVADIDFPDLGRAPNMQRDRRPRQHPLGDRTDMVGIDFLPKGDHASRAVQKRAGGGSRIRSVREGMLTGTAIPLHIGRTSQVWEI